MITPHPTIDQLFTTYAQALKAATAAGRSLMVALDETYQDADNLLRYRATGEVVPDEVEVH